MTKKLYLTPLTTTSKDSKPPKLRNVLIQLSQRIPLTWRLVLTENNNVIYEVHSEQIDLYDEKETITEIADFIPKKPKPNPIQLQSYEQALREAQDYLSANFELARGYSIPFGRGIWARGNIPGDKRKDNAATANIDDNGYTIKVQINNFRGGVHDYQTFRYTDKDVIARQASYQDTYAKSVAECLKLQAEHILEYEAKVERETKKRLLLTYLHDCSRDGKVVVYTDQEHPYITKKHMQGVQGLLFSTVRDDDQNRAPAKSLLVPMYDIEGAVRSMQYIDQDCNKRFFAGFSSRALFFPVGLNAKRGIGYNLKYLVPKVPAGAKLILVEGVATAVALYKLLGRPMSVIVLACMSIGGIEQVLSELQKQTRISDSRVKVYLSPDNDAYKCDNVGAKKGKQLVTTYPFVKLVLPSFNVRNKLKVEGLSDWDDLYQLTQEHPDDTELVKEIDNQLNAFRSAG